MYNNSIRYNMYNSIVYNSIIYNSNIIYNKQHLMSNIKPDTLKHITPQPSTPIERAGSDCWILERSEEEYK
jgi:hypothetical protein